MNLRRQILFATGIIPIPSSAAITARLKLALPQCFPAEVTMLPEAVAASYQRLLEVTADASTELAVALVEPDPAVAVRLTAMLTLLGRFHDRLVILGTDSPPQEIFFPRCRYLLREQLASPPPRWEELADLANRRMSCELPSRELYLQPDARTIWLGPTALVLSPPAFLLYWLLARRCQNGLPLLRGQSALMEELRAFAASTSREVMPELPAMETFDDDALSDRLEEITLAVTATLPLEDGREGCLPSHGLAVFGLTLPPEQIACPRNY